MSDINIEKDSVKISACSTVFQGMLKDSLRQKDKILLFASNYELTGVNGFDLLLTAMYQCKHMSVRLHPDWMLLLVFRQR
jgi:hypothetical protein